jgi:hypothetical protein
VAEGGDTLSHRRTSRDARFTADRRAAKAERRAANRAANWEARRATVGDDRALAHIIWDQVRAEAVGVTRQADVDLPVWLLVRQALEELQQDLAALLGRNVPKEIEGEEVS